MSAPGPEELRHRLSELDLVAWTGVCSICGPTDIDHIGGFPTLPKVRCATWRRAKQRRKWQGRKARMRAKKAALA
jgi:hypothetical protein